jgi:hypothetical protein
VLRKSETMKMFNWEIIIGRIRDEFFPEGKKNLKKGN